MRRRGLLAGLCGIAAGVARAATVDEVAIPSASGSLAARRAAPAGAARGTVLVAGDGTGSDAAMTSVLERLGQAGYVALEPALGEGSDSDALTRLAAAAAWNETTTLFVTGFGRGGRLAWLFAARARGLRAAVAWGSTAGAGERSGPLDVAGSLLTPVLGLYGARDPANSRSALLELERKGRTSGHPVEIITYADAAADFALPGHAGYDEAAALDGWQRMVGWFHRFGGPAPR